MASPQKVTPTAVKAEELFRKALSAAPRRADILVNFGNFLSSQGRDREAKSRLSKAIKRGPKLVSAWYHKGLLSLKTGELLDAKRCATRATLLAPRHVPAWELLAAVQQKCGETDAAIATHRENNILAVEMEAAALYAFAEARNKPVVCFAHITNQMASRGDDFEKGEADGVLASLTVFNTAVSALIADRSVLD